MRPATVVLVAFVVSTAAGASQGAGQAEPPKVSALPMIGEVERLLAVGTEIDLVLQTLLASSTAMADDRFVAVMVTAKLPPESMQPVTAAAVRGFLSSVRRPGPGRSALTLSFEEIHATAKPQRFRGSVTQVFQGMRSDPSENAAATAQYRGLIPMPGILIDVPGTVTSVDGKEVRLPPGTILRVRLEQPVTIRMPGL
jgi:hypothetical protein